MDHSYWKERDRMQKTDHCYFTVGKKTPQVVLRKAKHLKELAHDSLKSPVDQDHSYVRSHYSDLDHAEIGLMPLTGTSNDFQVPLQSLCINGPNVDEVNRSAYLSAEDQRLMAAEMLLTLESAFSIHKSIDDLHYSVECINLDHTYEGQADPDPSCDQSRLVHGDHEYESFSRLANQDCCSNHSVADSSDRPDHLQVSATSDNKDETDRADKLMCQFCESEPQIESIPTSDSEQKLMETRGNELSSQLGSVHHCDHAYYSNDDVTSRSEHSDHSYDYQNGSDCKNGDNPVGWWDHEYVDQDIAHLTFAEWPHSDANGRVRSNLVETALV